jgi:hypothetical protein
MDGAKVVVSPALIPDALAEPATMEFPAPVPPDQPA